MLGGWVRSNADMFGVDSKPRELLGAIVGSTTSKPGLHVRNGATQCGRLCG
jgi:hypothetical protein